jgi:hypothetical protein
MMPPVHALDLVLVANVPERTYWEWVLGQLRLLRLSLRQLYWCGVVRGSGYLYR